MNKNTKLFVNEMYIIEGTNKGWTTVEAYMTIDEINKLFKAGTVATVNVRENDQDYFGIDLNEKTFRIEFPTLETYMERIIEEAVDKIRFEQEINLDVSEVIFKISDLSLWGAMGTYMGGIKHLIEMDINYMKKAITGEVDHEEAVAVMVHEIGHYIHKKFFDFKQFRLPTAGKSKYACKDHKENFAEAFKDLVCGSIRNIQARNNKMKEILWGI